MKHILLATMFTIVYFSLVFAQNGTGTTTEYEIKPGDNLYNLAGTKLGDPNIWEKIIAENPILQEPGRKFQRDGKIIVNLYPGEKLVGLEKYGIVSAPITTPPAAPPQTTTPTPQPEPTPSFWSKWWIWAIIAVLVAIALWHMLKALAYAFWGHGATAGPAMVPDGINDQTAQRHFEERNHGLRLMSIQRIRATGMATFSYGNGATPRNRILAPEGETLYRAVLRDQNQKDTEHFAHESCGNDVLRGDRIIPGLGFRILSEVEIPLIQHNTEPSAEPTTIPTVPVETPTPAIASETSSTTTTQNPRIEFSADGSIVVSQGGKEIAFADQQLNFQKTDDGIKIGNGKQHVLVRNGQIVMPGKELTRKQPPSTETANEATPATPPVEETKAAAVGAGGGEA